MEKAERVLHRVADRTAGWEDRRRVSREIVTEQMAVETLRSAVLVVGLLGCVSGNKGFDKLENPTNLFKGYCVPLSFKTELGLCQGLRGNVRVCAAGTAGVNRCAC